MPLWQELVLLLGVVAAALLAVAVALISTTNLFMATKVSDLRAQMWTMIVIAAALAGTAIGLCLWQFSLPTSPWWVAARLVVVLIPAALFIKRQVSGYRSRRRVAYLRRLFNENNLDGAQVLDTPLTPGSPEGQRETHSASVPLGDIFLGLSQRAVLLLSTIVPPAICSVRLFS
jgi:hypothetical protein